MDFGSAETSADLFEVKHHNGVSSCTQYFILKDSKVKVSMTIFNFLKSIYM